MREPYLDLLKKSLTASLYEESAWQLIAGPLPGERGLLASLKRAAITQLRKRGLALIRIKPFHPELRDQGLDWPMFGLTMVGDKRLDNLRFCIETALQEGIPGDIVETGVWRGGSSIFAKAILQHHGADDRIVWCCDSFEGMPVPNQNDLVFDANSDFSDRDYLKASLESVKANFRKFGLLDDDKVKFLKGWFRDTLPAAPIGLVSVLRMDGDLYESTMDALVNLYDKVTVGGFVIVDDYHSWTGCREAVEQFRSSKAIDDPIIDIDAHAVYWRKSSKVTS
jgi:O-methyltransferase